MPTKIDEFSEKIGALQNGVASLGRSLDNDRNEYRQFREAVLQTINGLADAVRENSSALKNMGGEISRVQTDASILKNAHHQSEIEDAEARGAKRTRKAMLGAGIAGLGFIGSFVAEFAKYLIHGGPSVPPH